ncbi:MAG: hypothetical protein ACLVFN_05185 [Enterocloster sp.]
MTEKRISQARSLGNVYFLLPLTQEVVGITLKGFKYPLENKDIVSVPVSASVMNS